MVMDKKLLAVGIDPGTTTAIAFLDLDGKLVHAESSKNLDLNKLISMSLDFGKVILVGTDKAKVPGLVEMFATKFGARIIKPNEDLKVEEKRRMVSDYGIVEDHKRDAVASGLVALQCARQIVEKIDYYAEQNQKQNIADKIKEIVISKKISIRNAAALIEKKDEEDKIVDRVIEERKLSENDFLKIYEKLKAKENEILIMKNHVRSLASKIRDLEKALQKQHKPSAERKDNFSADKIKFLDARIISSQQSLEAQKSNFRKLEKFLLSMGDYIVVKRLDNLGWNEFNFKKKFLDIKSNDILLVKDPNIFSREVIEYLREKIFVILHERPVTQKVKQSLPFIFVDSSNLKIEPFRNFAFILKKEFEIQKNKSNWMQKVFDDYRREKESLLS